MILNLLEGLTLTIQAFVYIKCQQRIIPCRVITDTCVRVLWHAPRDTWQSVTWHLAGTIMPSLLSTPGPWTGIGHHCDRFPLLTHLSRIDRLMVKLTTLNVCKLGRRIQDQRPYISIRNYFFNYWNIEKHSKKHYCWLLSGFNSITHSTCSWLLRLILWKYEEI